MQNNLSSTVGNYSTTLGKRAWQLFVLDAALEKLAGRKDVFPLLMSSIHKMDFQIS